MMTSPLAAAVKNACEIFFSHNPKYPLWILLVLYLRKEGKLHIVENYTQDDAIDNLLWDWDNGADLNYATVTFSEGTIEKWDRENINNICIIGDISYDPELTSIVGAFKNEVASNNSYSTLFAPQWEPKFLLEVAQILLDINIDDLRAIWQSEAFDDLLIRVFATGHFRGEFMQPKELSEAVISIVHSLNNVWKIYNPCCGVGTYITSDAPFVDFIGEEKNDIIYNIALLRTKWYECDDCTLILGDSTISDVSDYSAMISTPPFESVCKGGAKENIIVPLIKKCLAQNKPGVFVTPASFCFSSTFKNLRMKLITSDALKGVIMLPAGLFAPYSGIQTAIIVIDPRSDHNSQSIRFVDASSFMDSKTNVLQTRKIEYAWKEASDYTVEVLKSEVIKCDYLFSPQEYLDLNIDIPEGTQLMSLDEIGKFIKEYAKEEKETVHWATLASFNNANILKTYSTSEIALGMSMKNALRINQDCILINATGGRGISLHIDVNGPIYTPRGNVAFIPNDGIILPQYLILELAKPYVANRIAGMGSLLFAKNVGRLKIIVPSLEKQKAAISQYQSELLSQMGVEMSLLKTRHEQESRQELETRKHRIGQILGDAVPAFESLYSFIQNTDKSFTRETEVDELFHSTFFEEMTSIQKSLKKATQLLKALTDEIDYSKGEDIDFCDFVATNAKELAPNKTTVSWFGELKENERPIIHFSEQDLKVIFENIFSNAKKYGFTDSCRRDYFIAVNFRCVEVENRSYLRLYISNNGSPLPSGMTPERVFEWGKGNGHGIGGWQIRNIIEHFGGTVSLEELPENPEGFTLRYVIFIPLIASSYE